MVISCVDINDGLDVIPRESVVAVVAVVDVVSVKIVVVDNEIVVVTWALSVIVMSPFDVVSGAGSSSAFIVDVFA